MTFEERCYEILQVGSDYEACEEILEYLYCDLHDREEVKRRKSNVQTLLTRKGYIYD